MPPLPPPAADPNAAGASDVPAPPAGTIERWCLDLVAGRDLARKLAPPTPPGFGSGAPRGEEPGAFDALPWEPSPPLRRLARPGRPAELRLEHKSPRAPRPEALVRADARVRLLHTFAHHELQAAELFAWAVLAFPEAPRAFRAGLVRLCLEELAHLRLYAARLEAHGSSYGALAVRDWFWERVPLARRPASFVALQGLGLEGANLEHSARFAAAFRAAGDAESARVLERVERDEVGHVAFALRWFERLEGAPLDYERWSAALPEPLSPALFRGSPLNRAARRRAGFDEALLARLAAAPPTTEARP